MPINKVASPTKIGRAKFDEVIDEVNQTESEVAGKAVIVMAAGLTATTSKRFLVANAPNPPEQQAGDIVLVVPGLT